jgi:hypothetical protein
MVDDMKLIAWLKSGKHLPAPMRDFHDQKNLFKSMHALYEGNDGCENTPNWVDGHIYIIDFFLWFMASRGYTLQRTRKNGVEFKRWPDFREICEQDNIDE